MTTATVFGSTGAVGSHILQALLASDTFSAVTTISRRLPPASSTKLEAIQEADTGAWADKISTLTPCPTAIFNAVGTTRASAGSIANQWKIDHDLCVAGAKAAKTAGVSTYVYISSAGTRGPLTRMWPYAQMKIGVEDTIRDLDFDHGIVLRPGMIIGQREVSKSVVLETVIGNLHRISQNLQDMIGQDQVIIGRAAVTAARLAQEGKAPAKFWVLEQADIIKYGRDEWKE